MSVRLGRDAVKRALNRQTYALLISSLIGFLNNRSTNWSDFSPITAIYGWVHDLLLTSAYVTISSDEWVYEH